MPSPTPSLTAPIQIQDDRWLSGIFGYGVFRLEVPPRAVLEDSEAAPLDAWLEPHRRQQAQAFYYAKVETDRIEPVRQLSRAGWYVVDASVTLERAASPARGRAAAPGVTIEERDASQDGAVLEIAASCFQYSRFHLDPLIPKAVANRVKRDWVLSYVRRQRGDRLWVASLQGRPVGFLAALTAEPEGRPVAVIDLIGVDASAQRQGIGTALVGRCLEAYAGRCERVRVGTQAANQPSLQLYERLGFTIASTRYVLHGHWTRS